MRALIVLSGLLLLTACSDPSPENADEGSAVAIERQIEGDAKSLEAAADEAVNVLKSKEADKLQNDGVVIPLPIDQQMTDDQEQAGQP
jgi:hypothetical protein